jgi:hypothetical protein
MKLDLLFLCIFDWKRVMRRFVSSKTPAPQQNYRNVVDLDSSILQTSIKWNLTFYVLFKT